MTNTYSLIITSMIFGFFIPEIFILWKIKIAISFNFWVSVAVTLITMSFII